MTTVAERHDNRYRTITDEIVGIPLDFPEPWRWWVLFGFSLLLLLVLGISVGVLFWYGVGVFGNNVPVSWGFPIVNYIWFLGIGHAGTLISALLLLTGTTRRNSLNRFAETMTLCAVICAGLYPILHLGRPWLFYWTAPYPNTMTVWPQFQEPADLGFLRGARLSHRLGGVLVYRHHPGSRQSEGPGADPPRAGALWHCCARLAGLSPALGALAAGLSAHVLPSRCRPCLPLPHPIRC